MQYFVYSSILTSVFKQSGLFPQKCGPFYKFGGTPLATGLIHDDLSGGQRIWRALIVGFMNSMNTELTK